MSHSDPINIIFKFILTWLINWSIELLHVIVEVTET